MSNPRIVKITTGMRGPRGQQGPPGGQGIPGPNTIPAKEAIDTLGAELLEEESALGGALKATIATAMAPALVPDYTDPGFFNITAPTRVSEDPSDEGTFLIGVSA